MIRRKIFLSAFVVALTGMVACSKSSKAAPGPVSSQSAQTVLYWNEIAYEAFGGTQYQHSLMASRINAMVQLAIHDALNGIEEKYQRYAFSGKDKKADPIAAASSAAHAVLVNEIPAGKAYLDSVLAVVLNKITEGDAKTRGIALGKEAAQAVLAKRGNDGSAKDPIVPVPPSAVAGVYQTVPPFTFQFAPFWQDVKLFSLQSKEQFRCAPFPALNSPEYTAAFNEVKEFGKFNSAVRTPDQTFFTKFWYEFSEAGWNRVARVAIVNKKLNMLEAARLLALVDMAIADAYIAGWDSKIHYNFWRPYTAIRKADSDGNNNTLVDANWEPSDVTPPIHDYPSTHSALGNAAATVMAKLLGDNTPFSMTSPTALPAGSSRSFNSFSQAAIENAESRVMAGIHFRFSCAAGLKLGADIGTWTVDNHLKPLK
jgi:hypothetical protein